MAENVYITDSGWQIPRIKEMTEDKKRYDRLNQLLYDVADRIFQDDKHMDLLDGSRRTAVIIGSSYGLIGNQRRFLEQLYQTGAVLPSQMLLTTNNLLSELLALKYKIHGDCFTIVDGATSGCAAIEMGIRLIRSGVVDSAVAGGVDTIDEVTQARVEQLRRSNVIKPDYVCNEGCAAVLLEAEQYVKNKERRAVIDNICQGSFYDCEELKCELKQVLCNVRSGDLYYGNMNSSVYDEVEEEVCNMYGIKPVAIKKITGETGAASGVLQVIAAADIPLNSYICQIGFHGKYSCIRVKGGIIEKRQ